jgi:hypothetical protein
LKIRVSVVRFRPWPPDRKKASRMQVPEAFLQFGPSFYKKAVMGNQRLRRQAFFEDHPHCCFCGEAATEEDHIPARHLFRDRAWPEGYVFPACGACNDSSALDELLLGVLLRIRLNDYSPEGKKDLAQAIEKVNRRRPEWIRQLKELTRAETRQFLRERGMTSADFPGGEVYIMTLPDEHIAALERYAQKLGKALYYMHTGRIVPSSGLIKSSVATNSQYLAPTFPWHAFTILTQRPVVARSKKSLEDQFVYRYSIPEEGGAAGFVVQFGESTVMTMLVVEDAGRYRKARDELDSLSEGA